MSELLMDKYTYFWILIILSMACFFIGAYKNIIKKIAYVLWLNEDHEDTAPRKDNGGVSFPGIKTILNEAIFQSRIKERSRFLWSRHFLIFAGFVLLFLFDGFFALTTKYCPVDYFKTGAGRSFLKLGLESTGAILLVGLTLGLIHRLIYAREEENYIDIKLLLLLWVVVVTGFLTESFRFVLEPDDPHMGVSFIGGSLAELLRKFPWPWEKIYAGMWIAHATVTGFFFAYTPFSKFVHVFVAPVGRSVTMAEGYGKRKRENISEGLL